MIIKGFKFGMLLQLAVGPICLLIFQTAVLSGFLVAVIGVIGVTIVDTIYILLAILGLGTLLSKHGKAKIMFKYIGSLVLILFGVSNILGAFGISILPSLNFILSQKTQGVLLKVILLTLSNPLTILFWASVFSTKIIEQNLDKNDMYLFGFGAVLSTMVFLTGIAVIGSIANTFIASSYITVLNIFVGTILIGLGLKTLFKKTKI